MKQLLTICVLLLCAGIHAQHPVYFQLKDEDGLPSNEVYQIVQDKEGFIWIGCEDGLFRYDGNTFRKYRNSSQNGVAVSDLRLDEQNRVWCRNFTGQLYRVDGDSLRTITDVSKMKMASTVYALQPEGRVWIIQNNFLMCYSDKGQVVKRIPIKEEGGGVLATHMVWHNGSIFAALNSGEVLQVNAENGKKKVLESSTGANSYTAIFYIWTGQLFMAKQHNTLGAIDLFSLSNDRFIRRESFSLGRANARIFHYGVDSDQRLWFCTSDGLKPFRSSTKDLDDVRSYFPGKNVSYVLKDREGTYWVSTLQDGLFIIPSFEVISYNKQNCGIPEDNLTALCLNGQGKVYTGSYTGLISEIDPRNGAVVNYHSKTSTVSAKDMVCLGDQVMVAHGPLSLLEGGELIAQYPVYQLRDITLQNGKLHYVSSSLSGNISINDLSKVNKNPYGRYEELGGRSVGVAKSGLVYYGLNSGLFLERNGKRKEIQLDGRQIVAASISVIGEQAFVATITHGLLLIIDGKIVKHWSRNSSGISDELRLVSVSKRYIWACSNDKLYRIDAVSGRMDRFDRSHGIISTGINAIQIVNGQVYMATDKGLITFPEELNWRNSVKPLLRIRSVLVDDVPYHQAASLEIPYRHRTISFMLDAPVLRDKEMANFRYRFAGNNTWSIQPVNRRTLDFNNLSPGNYVLQLASVNGSGVWSDIVEYRFYVHPPFWQKWWFYALISVLSMLIVAGLAVGRIRYIRRKEELRSETLQAQLKALKAQMNPHFMYNALNSIQALIIQKDIVNSNLYLSKFSNLMRKILDASDRAYISLEEEIRILELYLDLEKLRFGNEFTYTISVTDDIDPYSMDIPSILLQPFVENALKHGLLHKKGEKKLEVLFSKKDHSLNCIIRDNGVGRKRSEEIRKRQSDHRSFATEALHKQVALMNDHDSRGIRVEVSDLMAAGEPAGTEVHIMIPQL